MSSKLNSRSNTKTNTKILKEGLEKKPEKAEIPPDHTTSKISKQELIEKEYQESLNKKKLQQQAEEKKYKNTTIRVAKEETILCLAIDGSTNSKEALEIFINSSPISSHFQSKTEK